MKITQIAQLCMWLLGAIGFCLLIAQLMQTAPLSLSAGKSLTAELSDQHDQTHAEIISALTQADIVYLGETHNSVEDHEAQYHIIAALYEQNNQLAIALEMFQRPYQFALDQYLAGEISEGELRTKTEYDQRWGFEWEYYAPILRFAQAHRLPLLALNTPTEVTRKVARQGLASLSASERRTIPPLSEIRTDNAEYRRLLQDVYAQHSHGEQTERSFENFFAAQVLWDETMAETVAQFWQANPSYQVVVLAGQGHIIYDYGIPSRVVRRFANSERSDVAATSAHSQPTQATVLLGTTPDSTPGERPAADYFWEY
ncbi:MAG: ChaN family lipoprotein [Cyanophyceae cyanobacterium]